MTSQQPKSRIHVGVGIATPPLAVMQRKLMSPSCSPSWREGSWDPPWKEGRAGVTQLYSQAASECLERTFVSLV